MRQLYEYAKMALRNIIGNKMRSLLTMLGIIIGIAAVIIVLCIGSGGQRSIESNLSGIANGSVYIMAAGDNRTRADYFTDDDITAISQIPGVAGVTMVRSVNGTAHATREDVAASIQTGNEAMSLVSPPTMERGRYWNLSDVAAARKVCTIDVEGAKELFGSDNVLGMTIQLTIGNRSADFTVIGITQTSGFNIGSHVTAQISAPITSLKTITEAVNGPYTDIALLAQDPTQSAAVGKQAVTLTELRHGNAGRDMYYVVDASQFMSQINTVIGLFTTIIAAVAGISLLVGGIGVMNIMLVSVTERTREIGIRKALGAKTRTILFQFLIESATLTLVGGLIGILLGVWGGWAIGSYMGIDASISPQLIVYIVLFSSAIGIFFGIYPARKAARLNPIDALRSE